MHLTWRSTVLSLSLGPLIFEFPAFHKSDSLVVNMDPNLMQRRVTSGSILQNEFLLQGSILDESRDALLHKLRGFCDHSDVSPPMFQDHEMVYAISEHFKSKLHFLYIVMLLQN